MFTVEEVAHILNINPRSVRRLIDCGLLKCSRALRHIRIPQEAIDEFITNTTTPSFNSTALHKGMKGGAK